MLFFIKLQKVIVGNLLSYTRIKKLGGKNNSTLLQAALFHPVIIFL